MRSDGHDIDTTFDELGPALELLVGGTPARGLAIGGGQTWGGVEHTVGVLGPFVDYFPDNGGGVHVGGMAGIGVARGVPNARESPPNLDFGASIWAGYAFWLTDQLSLGLIGRFIYALDKKYDPVLDEAGTSYQLLITALYH